ncbi:THO complex subunit 3 [Phtheirospermum japonicum]|uniref:THO complex subunit 3 n=1 Tax=Phtheirospermum japonicum TaxID=374723 RepID=A0A830CY68_9LAMI|nr:THO complex subunit 3 [Phtheirospermum japonicum]
MEEAVPFKALHSREYQGHKKKVHSVAWNCSGTKLASGSVDQTARVWHIEPHGHAKVKDIELKGHTDSVDQLCWDPKHADLIATASGDKTVRLWDARSTVEVLAYPSLRAVGTLMAHTAGCYCIAIDPLGRYFAVGSADSLVSLWDIKDMLCVRTFTKLEWPVRTISFNHTGEYIASASEDLFIDIAHVQTGRSVHQIPCRAAMNSVEWNPKYNLLAYAGDDKNKYQADEGVFRIFGFESA